MMKKDEYCGNAIWIQYIFAAMFLNKWPVLVKNLEFIDFTGFFIILNVFYQILVFWEKFLEHFICLVNS